MRASLIFALALAACGPDAEVDAGTDAGVDAGSAARGEGEGAWATEVTADSVILSARITVGQRLRSGDVRGAGGVGRFELIAPTERETEWIAAIEEDDFIVRARVDGLAPDTEHRYRFVYGPTETDAVAGAERTFSTLPAPDAETPVRLAVLSCMHYDRFLASPRGRGPDGERGYPGLEAIDALDPRLLVLAGDVLYYDHPPDAMTQAELRVEWHRLRGQPRMIDLLGSVASLWMKDDHDYRYDDADPLGDRPPSATLGRATFYEQAGLGAPSEPDPTPYRTVRLGAFAQIWLLESREYRSANDAPDDADKTLWGLAQRQWLQDSLLASDAPFRIVITPTPLLGPDDARKTDNHTNLGGFRTEGEAFLSWAEAEGLPDAGLLLVTGDRHWQYHSVHPNGVEELSVGALVEGNARVGVAPGDPEGTDPDALIEQRFTNAAPTGGFLWLTVDREGAAVVLRAELRDEDGAVQYMIERRR